jgi:hypothetical protein
MPSALYLQIVILDVERDVWCGTCGVASATKVTYVCEAAGGAGPAGLRLLTYCQTCESG